VIAAVFSVVAFFYYAAVARQMWFREPVELGEATATVRTAWALNVALALTTVVVVVVGVYPQLFARIGDLAFRPG
jgi:NADH:ubiquinone oxidoreductase subunit 2 (subunit N)